MTPYLYPYSSLMCTERPPTPCFDTEFFSEDFEWILTGVSHAAFVFLTPGVKSAQNTVSPPALASYSSLEDSAEHRAGQASSRAKVS